MIFSGRIDERAFAITLREGSLTASIDERLVIACDRGGRLYSVYRDGATFRRGLDGRILQKWRGDESRQRRWLTQPEADDLLDAASESFRWLRDSVNSPHCAWAQAPDAVEHAALLPTLERAAAFDSAAARADAEAFARVYRPIGILPPDQYLALVLQATEGCSFHTCTFCDLYHHPYRVKPVEEFRQHIADVRNYLGDSITLRQRSIFLGAANALAAPMPRLVPLFESMGQAFGASAQNVCAFVDGFTGARKSADDYRVLAGLGLRRVYIGLESGHDPLLRFVSKPATGADVIETVRATKSAGVSVAVIAMIGLGGDRFAEGHVADTAATLNAMPLGAGDLIYFSTFLEQPDTPYPALAARHTVRPLSAAELAAQRDAIRGRLTFGDSRPQISIYDIREFVY